MNEAMARMTGGNVHFELGVGEPNGASTLRLAPTRRHSRVNVVSSDIMHGSKTKAATTDVEI